MAAATPKLDTSAIEAAAAAALPTSFLPQFRAAMDEALPRLDVSTIQGALDAAVGDIDWESLRQALEADEAEADTPTGGRSTTEALYASVAVLLACLILAHVVAALAQPLGDAVEDTVGTAAMTLDLFAEMVKRVPGLEGVLILLGLRGAPRRRGGDAPEDQPPDLTS